MKAAVFGIGSLLSPASVIRSGISVRSVKPSRVNGFERAWIEPFEVNGQVYAALGIRETTTKSDVIGSTLFVSEASIEDLLDREEQYRHIIVAAIDNNGKKDRAITFETRREAPPDALIPLSYLATVVSGFGSIYGISRIRDFFNNTTGWNRGVYNDVSDPVYKRVPSDYKAIVDAIYPVVLEYSTIK